MIHRNRDSRLVPPPPPAPPGRVVREGWLSCIEHDLLEPQREASAAPRLLDEILLVLIIIGAGVLIAWAGPDLRAWLSGARPAHTSAAPQQCGRAEYYTSVVTACLNAGHCREAN